jgi:glycosyltransferase involved in cell wall biosynthesis
MGHPSLVGDQKIIQQFCESSPMTSAHLAGLIMAVLSSLLAVGWLWQAVRALRGVPMLPDLTRADAAWPDQTERTIPDVTVIVPACNEEEAIQTTLRSLLASTGVRLQIVAVDDRSTDRTGALMDAVAAEAQARAGSHTLEVIHNRDLPQGWMGKAHALAIAAERATAPWLLFTDGDVAFDPRTMALGVGYAEAEKADHVVLLFTLELKSIAEGAVFAAFQALAAWNMRLWKVADPVAKDFFGAGGFNLVRREVYERLGGFAALRMEIVEDLRLGWKIKRAGYAQRIVIGPGLVRIRWIDGALSIVGLMEKERFCGTALSRWNFAAGVFWLCGADRAAAGGDCMRWMGRCGGAPGLRVHRAHLRRQPAGDAGFAVRRSSLCSGDGYPSVCLGAVDVSCPHAEWRDVARNVLSAG